MNKWIETIEQSVYKLDEYYNKKIDNNKKLEFVVTLLLILGILIEIYLLNKPTPWVSDDLTKSNLHWSTYFGHKISKIRCQKNK